jgi:hypothetical protein
MDDAQDSEGRAGDRREAGRSRVMIPATIRCPDGDEVACVLRDMSADGAKLSVSRRHPLPESFTLAIPGQGRAYAVRRRWQRADLAGIVLDLPQPKDDA